MRNPNQREEISKKLYSYKNSIRYNYLKNKLRIQKYLCLINSVENIEENKLFFALTEKHEAKIVVSIFMEGKYIDVYTNADFKNN